MPVKVVRIRVVCRVLAPSSALPLDSATMDLRRRYERGTPPRPHLRAGASHPWASSTPRRGIGDWLVSHCGFLQHYFDRAGWLAHDALHSQRRRRILGAHRPRRTHGLGPAAGPAAQAHSLYRPLQFQPRAVWRDRLRRTGRTLTAYLRDVLLAGYSSSQPGQTDDPRG